MLIPQVIAKVVATSVVWRRGGAPKRLSACPPLEIIDRAMPLIFVGPRHVKYGLLILILILSSSYPVFELSGGYCVAIYLFIYCIFMF